MYRQTGPRPRPSLYTMYYCTLWSPGNLSLSSYRQKTKKPNSKFSCLMLFFVVYKAVINVYIILYMMAISQSTVVVGDAPASWLYILKIQFKPSVSMWLQFCHRRMVAMGNIHVYLRYGKNCITYVFVAWPLPGKYSYPPGYGVSSWIILIPVQWYIPRYSEYCCIGVFVVWASSAPL